jgi:hypothetical protein
VCTILGYTSQLVMLHPESRNLLSCAVKDLLLSLAAAPLLGSGSLQKGAVVASLQKDKHQVSGH